MLMILFLTVLPAAYAQSGRGGSTEVRARIEAETVPTDEPTQPLPTTPEPSDDSPVQTGEPLMWCALAVLAAAGGAMVLVWTKNKTKQ